MPLYLTTTQTSRVQKPATLRRASSSPLATFRRTKSNQVRSKSLANALGQDEEGDESGCEDWTAGSGKIVSVLRHASAADVTSAMLHASSSMFESIPQRAGMNSVRIAEVLNFHKNLPPVVSVAHVHALITAASRTERQIQTLLAGNQIRKLKLVGRGNDVTGTSEVLISTSDYRVLLERSDVSQATRAAFLQALCDNPRASFLATGDLSHSDSTALLKCGFLVASSAPTLSHQRYAAAASAGASSIVAPSLVSRAASGTQAAVGGAAAFEALGGVGAARRSQSDPNVLSSSCPSTGSKSASREVGTGISAGQTGELALSAPNLGPYLRLLNAGRGHLLDLLRKSSKHHQAPLYLLREKWDGNIDNDSRVSEAKQSRGEFSNILPAKTKKWKALNGLRFDWVLAECLGAGLVELFETKSVGLGVRALV